MAPEPLTISSLEPILYNGHKYSYQKLKQIIQQSSLVPVDNKGRGGSSRYCLADVEVAVKKFQDTNSKMQAPNVSLKEQKLVEEIKKLKRQQELATIEIERANLEVSELKKTQMPTKEFAEYLQFRIGYETSILRRLLLINLPIETEGLDIRKKRKLLETYYNEIMKAYNESVDVWQNLCNDSSKVELTEATQKFIDMLNEHLAFTDTNANDSPNL